MAASVITDREALVLRGCAWVEVLLMALRISGNLELRSRANNADLSSNSVDEWPVFVNERNPDINDLGPRSAAHRPWPSGPNHHGIQPAVVDLKGLDREAKVHQVFPEREAPAR